MSHGSATGTALLREWVDGWSLAAPPQEDARDMATLARRGWAAVSRMGGVTPLCINSTPFP